MLDWPTVVAILALGLAGVNLVRQAVGGNLSRTEHEEFKRRVESDLSNLVRGQESRLVIREYEAWLLQFRHDLQRVEESIKVLDQTKPTTGELDRAAKSLEARMVILEDRIKALNDRIFTRFPMTVDNNPR